MEIDKDTKYQLSMSNFLEARIDDLLGKGMNSYALDANVIIDVLGIRDGGPQRTEYTRNILNGYKSTIYYSTLREVCDCFNLDENPFFLLGLKSHFDKPDFRIVMDASGYAAHKECLKDTDLELADSIGAYENELGLADCHLIVQSKIESNTILTFDRRLSRLCMQLGVPVINCHKGQPVEYKGKWK